MKKLFASCAVVALMAGPALAQSTVDPQVPDTVPVEPEVAEPIDPMLTQPDTEVLPEELPAEPDMAEETSPPVPEGEAVEQADTWEQEDETFAQADPEMTAEIASANGALEAEVNEAELPEEYSTDDLNAVMLAQVNEVSTEIASMDAEADVWVSAGSDTNTMYAPEGQGDIEALPEDETSVTGEETYVTPEAETPETDYMEPEATDPLENDPLAAEDETSTEY